MAEAPRSAAGPAAGANSSSAAAAADALACQVFISHTGADDGARIFAASILKPALEASGLRVFIDFSSLEAGDHWPSSLVQAASSSEVVVVVLSESYPQRFWCLYELDLALHGSDLHPTTTTSRSSSSSSSSSGRPVVIPVFYHPSGSIRPPTGEQLQQLLADKLDRLDCTPEQKQLLRQAAEQRWAANFAALKDRQAIRRQHVDTEHQQQRQRRSGVPPAKDEEWQLARRVVASVVQHASIPVHLPSGLVGVEQQAAQLTAQLLVDEPGLLGLWLHGPGGLGKTTMADLLYNRLQKGFSTRASIELDFDDNSSGGSATGSSSSRSYLQAKLVQLLAQLGVSGCDQHEVGQLKTMLQQHVRDKAVLLLLDNVCTAQQLDILLPESFGAGSRIIITSRCGDMTQSRWWRAHARQLHIQQVELLTSDDATELFRQCSNVQQPAAELAELEQQLVNACDGLPLALQVLGGQLWCEAGDAPDLQLWQEVLGSFRGGRWGPNDSSERQLQHVVAHSFCSLSEAAQNMFLDCVSVTRGEEQQRAMIVWQAWWPQQARQAFQQLQRRSLVAVDKRGSLEVHDVIRVLGQAIILQWDWMPGNPFYGSRLWVGQDGRLQQVEAVAGKRPSPVGISLCGLSGSGGSEASLLQRCDLSQLRVFISVSRQLWPEPLQEATDLLWYEARYSSGWLWSNLLELDLNVQQLTSLRILVLEGSKAINAKKDPRRAAIAESLGTGTQDWALQVLQLCSLDLSSLPESFGQLKALSGLDLSGCGRLSSLPESLGQLAALGWLDLSDCSSLSRLPESFGQLAALSSLDLWHCSSLVSLSESLGQLTALSSLRLSDCSSLRSLPASFGQLTALSSLGLRRCSSLSSLPASFGQLTALSSLDLSGCSSLSGLPESLGQLTALSSLDLSWCYSLVSLPESLGQLAALSRLDPSGCSSLSGLPESLGQLTALSSLDLSGCSSLVSLPESLGQLAALSNLDLSGCSSLSGLPESLGQLADLWRLDLSGCSSLVSLPASFGQLTTFSLDLRSCSSLSSLPESLGQLTALRVLHLSGCSSLSSLPESLGQLTALSSLDLRSCSSLSSLPESFSRLAGVQKLYLGSTFTRAQSGLPWQLGHLTGLTEVKLGVSSDWVGGSWSKQQPVIILPAAKAPPGCWIRSWRVGGPSISGGGGSSDSDSGSDGYRLPLSKIQALDSGIRYQQECWCSGSDGCSSDSGDRSVGITYLQGTLQDGTVLPPLAATQQHCAMFEEVDQPQGLSYWPEFSIRDEKVFNCSPGSCIIGYCGLADATGVVGVGFIEEPAPTVEEVEAVEAMQPPTKRVQLSAAE